MNELQHVKYVGDDPTLKGKTGIMNSAGLVQLDFITEWHKDESKRDQRCYGWHDLGLEWQPDQLVPLPSERGKQ